jgi:hypothetical protein
MLFSYLGFSVFREKKCDFVFTIMFYNVKILTFILIGILGCLLRLSWSPKVIILIKNLPSQYHVLNTLAINHAYCNNESFCISLYHSIIMIKNSFYS